MVCLALFSTPYFKAAQIKLEKIQVDIENYFLTLKELETIEAEFSARPKLSQNTIDRLLAGKEQLFEESKKTFQLCLSISNASGFLETVFGFYLKPKRTKKAQLAVDKTKLLFDGMGDLPVFSDFITFQKFFDYLYVFYNYYNLISEFNKGSKSLEHYYLLETQLSSEMTHLFHRYWAYWTSSRSEKIAPADRKSLANYRAKVEMLISMQDEDRAKWKVARDIYALLPKVKHLLPAWAVTSLSARGKIPLEEGFFDLLVIDEASQCDLASVLPLIFRAKRITIIGDQKQLRHISSLKPSEDSRLLAKYDLSLKSYWSYSVMSVYDWATTFVERNNIVELVQHFRSSPDIIEFSNKEFYEGKLVIHTDPKIIKTLKDTPKSVVWELVEGEVFSGSNGGSVNYLEATAVFEKLKWLVNDAKYEGTIGIVTPFRAQAEAIRKLVMADDHFSAKCDKFDLVVDTVHKFQGDERDLMIFSPVVAKGIGAGSLKFLKESGNLFNVAITRARSTLLVVGDMHKCKNSGVPYLERFVDHVSSVASVPLNTFLRNFGEIYPTEISNQFVVSEWEKVFYEELYKNGIYAVPQYSVAKYRLDLALFVNGHSLNIEIDGRKYHADWNNELRLEDKIRNKRLIELGWEVKRFWVNQIRDDLSGCVRDIVEWSKLKTQGAKKADWALKHLVSKLNEPL